ncbi:MAG: ATP-binding protein [Sulfitobacter sp.]
MNISGIPARIDAPLADPLLLAALEWVRATLEGTPKAVEARARLDNLRAATPTTLDHISKTFGLAPVEEDLILFALAHRIDGGLAQLCASVAGDPRQGYITAQLLTQTIGRGDPGFAAALFARLAPGAPLRHWSLLEMRETHPLAAIALDEDVALRLAGCKAETISASSFMLPPQILVDRQRVQARELVHNMRTGLALVGQQNSGRQALAGQIAKVAGYQAVVCEPTKRARQLAREVWLDGLVLVTDLGPDNGGCRHSASDETALAARDVSGAQTWTPEAMQMLEGRLIVLAEDPTGLPRQMHIARIAPLSTPERTEIWRQTLPDWPAAERDAVARHFPLGPGSIATIAAGLEPDAPLGTLWQRCRERGGHGLEALATRIVPRFGWDDLIVPSRIRFDLKAIADQMRHRATVYDDWGFSQRLAAGRGITALFAGPSGTGKSMAAEVIAGALGLDLYKVDLSRLVSKYIGETEKNLRRVFDAAEQTGACLFLDEADAVLGKRSAVKDSHDRHANIEVSYLLQRMESFAGLCLLATNLKNNLDAAFLRRLRFVIDIPLPDQGDRLRIWKGAIPPGVPTGKLDFAALSRLDISGGSIVVIAVNAAFLAAAEGAPMSMDHIAQATHGEYRKHDRSFRAQWDGTGR